MYSLHRRPPERPMGRMQPWWHSLLAVGSAAVIVLNEWFASIHERPMRVFALLLRLHSSDLCVLTCCYLIALAQESLVTLM